MRRSRVELIVSSSIAALLIGVKLAQHPRIRSLVPVSPHQAHPNEPTSPTELSRSDWKHALIETKNALKNKNLPMLAAGVAFFSTLAFFPMLAAGVAIAAMVIDQHQLGQVIATLDAYLPKDLASMISTQLKNLTGKHTGNILVAIGAIIISLYSASSAVQNLINATNRSYDVSERRGFLPLKLISLLLTLGALILGFLLVPLLLVTSTFLTQIGIPALAAGLIVWLRWPLILAIITLALAAFYRYGPDRRNPQWQWVSWGASAATIIWLIATALFFLYAQHFGSFSKSYGVFAGIIILMTWLNVSAFIFLLGAEVNHHLEQQTDDSTVEPSS